MTALADRDLAQCRQALVVVQRLGAARLPVVDAVLGLFGNNDPALAKQAIVTAGYLDAAATRVVPALVARLSHKDEWPLVFQSLGNLGPAARESVPELEKQQAGADTKSAKVIANVIKRIRREAP